MVTVTSLPHRRAGRARDAVWAGVAGEEQLRGAEAAGHAPADFLERRNLPPSPGPICRLQEFPGDRRGAEGIPTKLLVIWDCFCRERCSHQRGHRNLSGKDQLDQVTRAALGRPLTALQRSCEGWTVTSFLFGKVLPSQPFVLCSVACFANKRSGSSTVSGHPTGTEMEACAVGSDPIFGESLESLGYGAASGAYDDLYDRGLCTEEGLKEAARLGRLELCKERRFLLWLERLGGQPWPWEPGISKTTCSSR